MGCALRGALPGLVDGLDVGDEEGRRGCKESFQSLGLDTWQTMAPLSEMGKTGEQLVRCENQGFWFGLIKLEEPPKGAFRGTMWHFGNDWDEKQPQPCLRPEALGVHARPTPCTFHC